jgi:hypothetical protein
MVPIFCRTTHGAVSKPQAIEPLQTIPSEQATRLKALFDRFTQSAN